MEEQDLPAPPQPAPVNDERLVRLSRQIGVEIAKARKTEQTADQALAQIESILTQATGGPIVDIGSVPREWLEEAMVAEREPPTASEAKRPL